MQQDWKVKVEVEKLDKLALNVSEVIDGPDIIEQVFHVIETQTTNGLVKL